MKLNKILTLVLLSISSLSLMANNYEAAESAYKKGEFAEAAKIYTEYLNRGEHSAKLYYNLGNCYYKMNQTAESILNYERALLLDPSDNDIRFNLEMARLRAVDKIDAVGKFWLTEWSDSIRNTMSADQWGVWAIIAFILLLTSISTYFLGRTILIKKIGFFTGLFFLLLTISAHLYGSAQYTRMTSHDYAIVFAQTVTAKSTPDASGNDLFVIHEGTKVRVKSTLGDWSEIEMIDGNVGWIPSLDIEKI